MSKSLATGLLGLGAIVLIVGFVTHFAKVGQIFPHFSIILAVVAVILLGIGAYGYFGQQTSA